MNSKILGLVIAVVAIGALVFVLRSPSEKTEAGNETSTAGQAQPKQAERPASPEKSVSPKKAASSEKAVPPEETFSGSPVTKEDVDRLPSEGRKMKGVVEVTGRGARAENGYEVSCDFYYVTEVAYESHVKERSVTPAGEVRVTETRRYEQCNDQITCGDFDAKVSLDTLPIHQVAPYVSAVTEVVGGWFGVVPGAGTALVESGVKSLYAIDGASAKKVLSLISGLFGDEVPVDSAGWVKLLVQPEVKRIHAEVKQAVQDISGREYLVTYYQSASGEPMRIRFERVDKTPLTMQEYRILREMNVFLSCHVIPTKCPAVGEDWDVQVGDLPGAFDSLSGGNKVAGSLKAKRLPDGPDGSVKVDIGGGRVAVLNDNGMENGSFMIDKGMALANAADHEISAFEMTGRGKLRVEDAKKRFLAFDFLERTEGDCQVRMTLTSEGAK